MLYLVLATDSSQDDIVFYRATVAFFKVVWYFIMESTYMCI